MSDDMNPVFTRRTVYRVDRQRKRALLKQLISEHAWSRIMIYVRTKYAVARLGKQLEQDGFNIVLVHNSMGKARRKEAIEAFTNSTAEILVSSDMATRGMTLPSPISCLINLDLPTEPCFAQRDAHIALAENALFLLSRDEEAVLREKPGFVDADYQFDVAPGFEPEPETAEQPAKVEPEKKKEEQPKPRRVRRGYAARKNTGRQNANRSERHTKQNTNKTRSADHALLDENGDINGNTLASDNSNRSAIDLACDGTGVPQGRGNTKLKDRRGNHGARRNRRQLSNNIGR